jgi:ABC-type uncharacterized transport system involved in gliding motility auxiliary subunit
LSTAIKKISVVEKPTIGFLAGHGEPTLYEMQQLNQQLQVLYNTTEITLTDSTEIPSDIETLVIIRPQDSLPTSHLNQLDNFMARGGKLAIALNRVEGNLQTAYGTDHTTGLEAWLKQKGLDVEPTFVADAQCGAVTLQQQQGFFTLQTQIAFPYLPIAGKFANHPVTTGLENVIFEFVSSIKFTGDTTTRFIPLIYSSDKSATFQAPQFFDVQKQWTEADLPERAIVMGAALEGKFGGNTATRMVVIADGDFPVNGAGQYARRLQPDNVNLLANAVDWLSDDTGLISLRTKGVTSRPIVELDDTTKTIIKYLNFALPLILVVAYGLLRFHQNRIKRLQRMSLTYEQAQ